MMTSRREQEAVALLRGNPCAAVVSGLVHRDSIVLPREQAIVIADLIERLSAGVASGTH